MKRTLVVKNDMSGNARRVKEEELAGVCAGDDVTEVRLTEPGQDYDVAGFDKVVVCGGDGTVNVALNKCKNRSVELYCLPSGTLNEKEKSVGKRVVRRVCKLNDDLFGYVAATGSFTEIGYTARPAQKRRFKKIAYLSKVLSAYKPYDIAATITADRTYEGRYSLIMAIDSDRCFGFRFNRAYREESGNLFLLLIKNTGKGLSGKIKMFFPFFRAFFIGFNGEYRSKNVDFFAVERAEIRLQERQIFCVDGERRDPGTILRLGKTTLTPAVFFL